MGAWGPGLFSDDLACDVRSDYRELIEDGVADEAATAEMLVRYADTLADPDYAPVVWLALAATQSKIGRLDEHVKANALAAIDGGADLRRWRDETPRLSAKRQAVLARLREQLVGPQPSRKRLRPPARHVTDLAPGDVLRHRDEMGRSTIVRVARLEESRFGVTPVVALLDWRLDRDPTDDELPAAPDWTKPVEPIPGVTPSASSEPTTYRLIHVSTHRQRNDYRPSGFEKIATTAVREATIRTSSASTRDGKRLCERSLTVTNAGDEALVLAQICRSGAGALLTGRSCCGRLAPVCSRPQKVRLVS
jgi:hypothetical protein